MNNIEHLSDQQQSKLDLPIQKLIKLIFNDENLKKTMKDFELDTEKLPLGKLSVRQLKSAYRVLSEISVLISNGSGQHDFIGPTNQFYSLIPHSFGTDNPQLIDNNEIIKQKTEMIDSLMEIEFAYSIMKKMISCEGNIIDQYYNQLDTELEVLSRDSEEYLILEKYVQNSHAETHKHYDLIIEDILKVTRKNERDRYDKFKNFPNRKLLWHGSRLTNWIGILKNGLKIAPPEAPYTGKNYFLIPEYY